MLHKSFTASLPHNRRLAHQLHGHSIISLFLFQTTVAESSTSTTNSHFRTIPCLNDRQAPHTAPFFNSPPLAYHLYKDDIGFSRVFTCAVGVMIYLSYLRRATQVFPGTSIPRSTNIPITILQSYFDIIVRPLSVVHRNTLNSAESLGEDGSRLNFGSSCLPIFKHCVQTQTVPCLICSICFPSFLHPCSPHLSSPRISFSSHSGCLVGVVYWMAELGWLIFYCQSVLLTKVVVIMLCFSFPPGLKDCVLQ